MRSGLPPGQQPDRLLRFGLPRFAVPRPVADSGHRLVVGGVVRRPAQIPLDRLLTGPRREQRSDLHCVTTWSALGLSWGGVRFADVHEILTTEVIPHPDAAWVRFTGLDGFCSTMLLADALAADVLLADRLGDARLTADHGAPARIVAPAHYGYKSVKHLTAVDYLLAYRPGSAGWYEHPRARVTHEERSRYLPGRIYRPIWRRTIAMGRARYAAVDRRPESSL